jgi:hypothetical protein
MKIYALVIELMDILLVSDLYFQKQMRWLSYV